MKERYQLDPAHTVIGFSVKHLGVTTVRGNFQEYSGGIEADRETLAVEGEVKIAVKSLTTGQEQRDNHLRSADFFEADRYPEVTYRIGGIEKKGEDTYTVHGDLTIKATTKPVPLEVTVGGELDNPFQPGGKIVSLEARGRINRLDFGLNWDGLAGSIPLAGHDVKLEIETELQSSGEGTDRELEAESA